MQKMNIKLKSLGLLSCILFLCTFQSNSTYQSCDSNIDTKYVNDPLLNTSTDYIELKTPIIFATYTFNSDYSIFFGKSLLLEMTDGVYDSEQGYYGAMWNGNFQFRLTSSNKNSNYTCLDSDIISCKTSFKFNEPFNICIDDYNNDGNPDFGINQWTSLSGGSSCHLFSLTKDGCIKPVKVEIDSVIYETLWLPKPYNNVYSPSFNKENINSFAISYFTFGGVEENNIPLIPPNTIGNWFDEHPNNTISEFILKNIYVWDNNYVMLSKQQILESNGDIWYTT